jgi:two-component system sensor histidine kinase YesM
MLFNFMRRSIKVKFFILMVFLGLLPIIALGIISNVYFRRVLEDELSISMKQALEKASANIGSMIQRMSYLSNLLIRSGELANSVDRLHDLEPSEISKQQDYINGLLRDISTALDFPTHVIFVDKHFNVFGNMNFTEMEADNIKDRVNSNPKFKISSNVDNTVHWVGITDNLLPGYDSDRIWYMARNIVYNGEYYGTIYIGTGEYIFSRMLNNIKVSDESRIVVFDIDKQPMFVIPESSSQLYGDDKNLYNTFVGQGRKNKYINYDNVRNFVTLFTTDFNWEICMITPVASISEKFEDINRITITITIISVFFVGVFLALINKNFIKPIVYLSNLMSIARKGNLDIRSNLRYGGEIGVLSNGFNKMLEDFKKMIERIKADEKLKKDLELKVLESRINPHFLYNTLNSIRWMAEMNNESKIADSIVSLVRMLEYSTKCIEKLVEVKQEIQYLKEYLHLQSLRYWNRFDCIFDIDQGILNCKILKLSLQPFVENSIIHGLDKSRRKTIINIKGKIYDGKLVFHISDNGAGMDEKTLNSLTARLKRSSKVEDSNSIGVANVNNRIKLEFGDEYGVHIQSVLGRGTDVYIEYPVLIETEDSGDTMHCNKGDNL